MKILFACLLQKKIAMKSLTALVLCAGTPEIYFISFYLCVLCCSCFTLSAVKSLLLIPEIISSKFRTIPNKPDLL